MIFELNEPSWTTDSLALTFAQNDGAPPLTTSEGGDASEGQPPAGGPNGQGTTTSSPFGSPVLLLAFAGFMVLMIVVSGRAQRKEKKRKESMLATMKKHDHVQTIGGVVGSIVSIKDDQVVLKVDESTNTRITFARAAVSQVLSSDRKGAPAEVKPLEQQH